MRPTTDFTLQPPPAAPASGLRVEEALGGAVRVATLATPRANVLDAAKIEALQDALANAAASSEVAALVIAAEGPDFSFGASVEEHLPGHFGEMLRTFHSLLGMILETGVPCLAAVRGRCLGGALELATFCHRLIAAPGARLAQPEIALGVFAPAASFLLPERVGRACAEELCLTGREVGAAEALTLGLVDQLADDPLDAALAWVRTHLLPRSTSSVRLAARAVRAGLARRFRAEIAELEELYSAELMATHDAVEGLEAFLAKRPPAWRNG